MTLKEIIRAQATSVFLNTDHFAGEVTRHPRGDAQAAEPVTAVWIPDDPVRSEPSRASREPDRGREVEKKHHLHVAESQTVHVDDAWLIEGELWQTVVIKPPEGGLVVLELQRHDVETRRRAGGGLL